MSYAVELYFDQVADAAVRQMWQRISHAGFSSPMQDAGYRPHLSLGVYDNDALNDSDLKETLLSYARTMTPFHIGLSSIGIFPTAEGVLFLGATVTQELSQYHAAFHTAFERFAADLWAYYRVGQWVPHCTLAYGLTAEEIAAVIPLCLQADLPLAAQVQAIGIVQVSPSSCSDIATFLLQR